MTSFDDRKKGEENKYAHQEELKFKTRVKGMKAFAKWCAEKMGIAVIPVGQQRVIEQRDVHEAIIRCGKLKFAARAMVSRLFLRAG